MTLPWQMICSCDFRSLVPYTSPAANGRSSFSYGVTMQVFRYVQVAYYHFLRGR